MIGCGAHPPGGQQLKGKEENDTLMVEEEETSLLFNTTRTHHILSPPPLSSHCIKHTSLRSSGKAPPTTEWTCVCVWAHAADYCH